MVMFRISNGQFKMFDALALERDIVELSRRLGEEHPEECMTIGTDTDRQDFVRLAHKEALTCGIRLKQNVYLFTEARLLLGPGFHDNRGQRPELVEFLQNWKTSEDKKADVIADELAMREVFI